MNSEFQKNMDHANSSAMSAMDTDMESRIPFNRQGDEEFYVNLYNRKPHSNWVQRITVIVLIFVAIGVVVVIGLASAIEHQVFINLPVKSVTVSYQSLGLPSFTEYSWNDFIAASYGRTVSLWYFCFSCW